MTPLKMPAPSPRRPSTSKAAFVVVGAFLGFVILASVSREAAVITAFGAIAVGLVSMLIAVFGKH